MAMDPDTLVFEALVNPATTPPADGAGVAAITIWKLSLKQYSKWMVQHEEAT